MTEKQKKLLAALPPPKVVDPEAFTFADMMKHYGIERSAAERKMAQAVESGKAVWCWGEHEGRIVKGIKLK